MEEIVSILTRSEDRVQQRTGDHCHCVTVVSILTRSEDRVQPYCFPDYQRIPLFQSSPDPKTGCNDDGFSCCAQFNAVSILTQSEDRVQPGQVHQESCNVLRFNPHPIRRPGATVIFADTRSKLFPFQSSPDPKTGCNDLDPCYSVGNFWFQSSPDPKTGCNCRDRLLR